MSACCHSGALLAGADASDSRTLADFGLAFGLAFQLLDDHKDQDALISKKVDIVEQALLQMGRARSILGDLPESIYRQELLRACSFVLQAVGVAQI